MEEDHFPDPSILYFVDSTQNEEIKTEMDSMLKESLAYNGQNTQIIRIFFELVSLPAQRPKLSRKKSTSNQMNFP